MAKTTSMINEQELQQQLTDLAGVDYGSTPVPESVRIFWRLSGLAALMPVLLLEDFPVLTEQLAKDTADFAAALNKRG